jgi:WD40 repeat protein
LLAGLCVTPANAQHFGRNKVQYQTFDFQVSRTPTFDIYFYPATKDVIPLTARMAERWDERLQRMLDHKLSSRQPLILYAAPSHFQQTNVIGGSIGEGTGGVTEGARRRVVMPFAGPLGDTDHVLGHELVHAYQYDMATAVALRSGQSGMAGMAGLPLWFIEGMAEYLSVGRESPLTAMWVRDAIVREKLPRVRELANPEYFPYRWGQALWAYIGGRWGDGAVRDMLVAGLSSGSTEVAIESVLGIDEEALSAAWHAALQEHFGDAARATRPPSAFGELLTEPGRLGGSINVSPSVSPDGTQVAFLSERDIFSVDLYVADARTGEIIRRLTRTAIDPHFSSLQFIASAGTWSPDGTRLAVAAIASGRPELAIYDVSSGRVARHQRLEGVDAAQQPTWSPDGRTIAFIGQRGGVTDLFLVDVESGTVTPLTDDPYTELHPSWSPDGRALAFSTDRFTTNLDTLAFGELRLAVMATDTRQVRPVDAFSNGKHINPQWTPDGRGLVFIGEPDGISNVFRVAVDGGGPARVTDVFTGISGITASSPALSVASRAGTTIVTAYEDGNHVLYRLEEARLTGAPLAVPARPSTAGILPPVRGTGPDAGVVGALLENATLGLPPATPGLETEPYSPSLKLDFVGQPSVAVGADRWGAFGGGALSFFMSDMLGDHSLGVAVQSNTSFNGEFSGSDIGGGIVYRNLKRRWNWGVMADQSPYRSGYAGAGVANVDGTPALVEQSVIFRQVDRGVSGLLEYPFSEAQRIEFSAGVRNLGFSQRLYTQAYDLDTGQLLLDEREDVSPGDGITFGHASAALVYDTSSFGATSPVLGQRYRLEAAPTFGDLTYTGVLADYRRYFMPVSFYTIAFRAMHYGRYGSSSEDPRLVPLFVGYPHLMRGYDVGTFEPQECPLSADGRCPSLDRLLGSRIAVANLELRFPLLRPFGVRRSMYGPIPVEAALFADAGAAWDSGNEANPMYRSDGRAVSSAGVALRVNALGFAVVQISYTKPFQRRDRGWIWQFSLAPGF